MKVTTVVDVEKIEIPVAPGGERLSVSVVSYIDRDHAEQQAKWFAQWMFSSVAGGFTNAFREEYKRLRGC